MPYVVGVDAGNTKTIAMIAAMDGTVVGWGRGNCGDIYGAGAPSRAMEAVKAAIETALERAAVKPSEITAGTYSMAGADWPEDVELLNQEITERGWSKQTLVVNDAIGGLRAGSPDGYGVSVISGTGVAIGARGRCGSIWTGGFWVEGLSGKDMARAALSAVLRAELGVGPLTAMREGFLAMTGFPDVEQMLHAISSRTPSLTIRNSESLGVLFRAAEQDDSEACRIVDEFGSNYAKFAVCASRKVGFSVSDPFPLVISGGVLKHAPARMISVIVDSVRSHFPFICPITTNVQSVAGALYWSLELAGAFVSESIIRRLKSSMPHDAFFSTY